MRHYIKPPDCNYEEDYRDKSQEQRYNFERVDPCVVCVDIVVVQIHVVKPVHDGEQSQIGKDHDCALLLQLEQKFRIAALFVLLTREVGVHSYSIK